MRNVVLILLGVLLSLSAPAQSTADVPSGSCPYPDDGWKPSEELIDSVLEKGRTFTSVFSPYLSDYLSTGDPYGGPDSFSLCNADLTGRDFSNEILDHVDLRGANLRQVNFDGARLVEARLEGAQLEAASLRDANLMHANLDESDLTEANLEGARLYGAVMKDTILQGAILRYADLSRANLANALLEGANLEEAILSRASMRGADLRNANLERASLQHADLRGAGLVSTYLKQADLRAAELAGAFLVGTDVTDVTLGYADLTGAMYSPESAPPDAFVAGIRGVQHVRHEGEDRIGLVQLRQLFREAGLRNLEREATYAIERRRTENLLRYPMEEIGAAAEGIFRWVAFDVPTAYGLHPARALLLVVLFMMAVTPFYAYVIHRQGRGESRGPGHILISDPSGTREDSLRILHRKGWRTLMWGGYFSLVSAFRIGFREINVGDWVQRIQRSPFDLRARGWARTVSGLQSLLSLYLVAIFLLTYFGRPFH